MSVGLSLVPPLLADEVGQEDSMARDGMRGLIEESKANDDFGPGNKWNGQDAYAEREDRLLSRHERPGLRGFGEKS
jgi:hypothetical protein